jgi:hypothetical protein
MIAVDLIDVLLDLRDVLEFAFEAVEDEIGDEDVKAELIRKLEEAQDAVNDAYRLAS